jgi:dethiobiotin synthetase
MSYFVTGTDTGVGKTLVSCALLHAFAVRGLRVVGMKPVACGSDDDGHNEDVRQLRTAGNVPASHGQISPYNFIPAIAPHIAARNAGVRIEFARIRNSYNELAAQADVVIIEGVGGFRVPLNETQDGADLAAELGLPVVLVVGMRLGCLNHALLTAAAIGASGLELAGWVANVVDENMAMLDENIAALEQRLGAPLLGVIERLPQPDAHAARLNIELLKAMDRADA